MRRASGALALAGLLLAAAASAQDHPAVVVTDPGARTFKAAVQGFGDRQTKPGPEHVAELRQGIGAALAGSGVFTTIDPKAYLGPDTTASLDGSPTCPDWSQIGADALVDGVVVSGEQGLTVEFRIWDVVRCRRLLHKRYFGDAGDLDRVGRRIADDVVLAFTGQSGVAATEIAFISDRSGRKEVHVMNADGSDVRAGTHNRSINAFPQWSPNGNEIVYTSYRLGGQPTLYLLTRGRNQPGPLLQRVDKGAPIYRGVFDPAGRRLAFVMSVDGAPDIFVSAPDGSGSRQLTRHRSIDISPSWSPDGKRLAFVSDRTGSPQVYVMDADGGNERRLTYQGSYNTAPAWSPDGGWIAYETRVAGQFDIWLTDPDGRTAVPLITHPRSDEGPSWSPDGRWLAFSSTRRGRADIYRIGIDGGNLQRLTSDAGENTSPTWGPFPGSR